jgi:hypothetical protein
MGIPVAAAIVAAAAASVLILARAAVAHDGRSRGWLAAITGIAVLSYLHSLVDFSLQIPGHLILFGILIGCGLGRASSIPSSFDSVHSESDRSDLKPAT